MFGLLLEGVFNHVEVIWLETRWSLRRLFRSHIHSEFLGKDIFDGWLEVMPSAKMLRFCDYRGSVTWRYNFAHNIELNGRCPTLLQYKGWSGPPTVASDDVYTIVTRAEESIFYNELEACLDQEALPVERSSPSEE